jgi:hypothetical protein
MASTIAPTELRLSSFSPDGEPMTARARIRSDWRIRQDIRTTRLGGMTLFVSNRRVSPVGSWSPDRWGCVRWLVADDVRGTIATGRVYQGVEYVALVRQAMLDAELAAIAAAESVR